MPWFHNWLSGMVKDLATEDQQTRVFEGVIATLLICHQVVTPKRHFHSNDLINAFNIPYNWLETVNNHRRFRRFDITLKRLTFERMSHGKAETMVEDLIQLAYPKYRRMVRKLNFFVNLRSKSRSIISKDAAQILLRKMIMDNLAYFQSETNVFPFEMKVGIVSKFHSFLTNHAKSLRALHIQTYFFGLCQIYLKLENWPGGEIWLSDFYTDYLEQASHYFRVKNQSEADWLKKLTTVERETLKLHEYNMSTDLNYFTSVCLLPSPNHIKQAVITELQNVRFDSSPDEYLIEMEARYFSMVLKDCNIALGHRYLLKAYFSFLLKQFEFSSDHSDDVRKIVIDVIRQLLNRHYLVTPNHERIEQYLERLRLFLGQLSKGPFILRLCDASNTNKLSMHSLFAKRLTENQTPGLVAQSRQNRRDLSGHEEQNNDTTRFFA